jgi:cobalt-zinc-cadmium efflux system membrane fusion protein
MTIRHLAALIRAKYLNLPERHKPIAVVIAAVSGVLLLVLLSKGCQVLAASQKKQPAVPMMIRQGDEIRIPKTSALRTHLKLQTVLASTEPHEVILPGIIEADPTRTVNVLPPLTGRLLSLNVKLGDSVEQDQPLATISAPDLALAHANHERALATLALTKASLDRATQVYRAGGNSQKDVQLAQSNYTQAQSETKSTQARLNVFDNNDFSQLTIKAPMQGRVTAINYGVGSFINDPTATLLTLSDLKTLWITAHVPETLTGAVVPNQEATIHLSAYPNDLLHAKISFVDAVLDPDTHRNKTRMTVPNPEGKFQPNMFASVHVMIPQPKLIHIPISAILMNNDKISVYVETAPWIFKRREVSVGLEDKDTIRILSGLRPGERIVTSGGVFIND